MTERQIDRRATLQAIRRAFEVTGVEFIDENGGPGVRQKSAPRKELGRGTERGGAIHFDREFAKQERWPLEIDGRHTDPCSHSGHITPSGHIRTRAVIESRTCPDRRCP